MPVNRLPNFLCGREVGKCLIIVGLSQGLKKSLAAWRRQGRIRGWADEGQPTEQEGEKEGTSRWAGDPSPERKKGEPMKSP